MKTANVNKTLDKTSENERNAVIETIAITNADQRSTGARAS